MITQASGFTNTVVHSPSYSEKGLKFSQLGSLSTSTLFSLYSSITSLFVGLQRIFSVNALPVSSYFTAFLSSPVYFLVHPINITKLRIISTILNIFFPCFKLITHT